MFDTVIKQPNELIREALPFDHGALVTEILSVSVQPRGLVIGGAALVAEGSLFGGAVSIAISGGADGERYLITGRATVEDGTDHESEIEVAVIDAEWAMPDGGAPYLTIQEFVARFGLEETVRMTDGNGSGRIDRTLLVSKLVDAQALVETHLVDRYSLPLGDVPIIVKMMIADLARARLYPGGAPDGVSDASKTALKMLERIQAGTLPIATATPIAPSPTVSNPVVVAPGHRQYPDGLRDY